MQRDQRGTVTERWRDGDTEIQRYRDTEIQRYKDTEIQKYRYIQRYRDTEIQRDRETEIQRDKVASLPKRAPVHSAGKPHIPDPSCTGLWARHGRAITCAMMDVLCVC